VHADGDAQATADRLVFVAPVTLAVDWIDHLLPLDRSASAIWRPSTVM
jgi:hypothetical protein